MDETSPTPVLPDRKPRPNLPTRVAVVFVGFLAILLSLDPLLRLLGIERNRGDGASPWPGDALVVFAVVVCALSLVLLWLARRFLDRRPWSGLTLTGPRRGWWPFTIGALAWMLPASAGLGLGLALGLGSLTPLRPTEEIVVALLGTAILVLFLEALPEEAVFRGLLFRNLNTVMSAWLAIAVQALLFALGGCALWVILAGWGTLPERLPMFLGMGVVLGCLRVITGNVWACVGFHLVFQTLAQGLLSGGLFEVAGGEALPALILVSPFVLGVLTAILLNRGDARWGDTVPDPVAGRAAGVR
ncbi:CPBP family intramembrane glutamic endopeptidase [Nocardiopsis sp. MG754419]|uniref:CPBP family intramembrane glutamic endopeptidase n=1 Tax=Nocardiopsis sp. MG754419 TaxID=2259865 RepID=UPI001BA78063|nr:CPBP family intramembrane glutamic endopeptidase [Nocardiopsis sp. MG754419]MBR8742561.1 CPBP family intramembrane metalloprotease [Nocardiopsis sp. MG754419]